MPEFSRFKLEVGQLFWDGGSTQYVICTKYCTVHYVLYVPVVQMRYWSAGLLRTNILYFTVQVIYWHAYDTVLQYNRSQYVLLVLRVCI